MNSIKTVIFDIGNVLLSFRWNEYVDRLWGDEAQRVTAAIWFNHRWDDLDRGVADAEDVLVSFIESDPEIENQIKYTFANIEQCIYKMDYAIPWIKELKAKGFRVLFLSNYSVYLREKSPEVLDFIEYMDGGVFSCDVHLTKPDPAIYRLICDRYDLIPEECIFIDDNKDNIASAKEFGLNAVLFDNYEKVHKTVNEMLS